jgi:hypothetical protein
MKGTFTKVIGAFLSMALVGAALGFLVGIIDMTKNQGFEYTLVGITAASMLYWIVLRGPLGRAIAGMLEDESLPDATTVMRLEDVEDRVQELSLESQRFREIEERLEFTERLLARQSEARLEEPR